MSTAAPKRISELGVIEFLNSFSLPVVAGSLATSFFFSRFFRSDVHPVVFWLLPSTVWFIYTLDHLLDGMKLGKEASSLRHQIHFHYRKELKFILFVIGFFNALLAIFFLPWPFLGTGLLLVAFVSIYFFMIHLAFPLRSNRLKELSIAIGVWLGMLVLPGIPGSLELNVSNLYLHLAFISLNMCNLMIFSYFDYEMDIKDGFIQNTHADAKMRLKNQINYVFTGTFVLIGLWAFSMSTTSKLPVIMALLLMLNTLMVLMLRKDAFRQNDLYRLIGDLIYLLPGLIWFLLRNKPVF